MSALRKEICRTCLSGERSLLPLSASFEPNITVADYFRIYLNYEVESIKEFPQVICLKCLDTLFVVKQFYLQCKESEKCLQRNLQIKTETISLEDIPEKSKSENEIDDLEENILQSVGSAFASEEDLEEEEFIEFIPQSESSDEIYLNNETTKEIHIEYKCKECGDCFDTIDSLDEHRQLLHENSRENNDSFLYQCKLEVDIEDSLVDPDEQDIYYCNNCKRNFDYKKDYEEHMSKHKYRLSSTECPECGKTFSCKNNLRKHFKKIHLGYKSIPSTTYDCTVCEKKYFRKDSLEIHKRKHTGERPFKCTYCDKTFTQKNSLTTHMTLHTGKRIKCPLCDKYFSREAFLRVHTRFHTNERPYICDKCPKSYFQMTHLRTHQLSHTGERPFSCKICGKSYTQKSTLQQHMFSHGKPKPFKCLLCPMEFSRPYRYRKHMAAVHNVEEDVAYPKTLEAENSQEEKQDYDELDEIYNVVEENN